MSQTIQISERSALLLNQQASARGKSLEEWVEELAVEHAQANSAALQCERRAAVEGILELQKQVKPDPDGWTIRETINYGRRSWPDSSLMRLLQPPGVFQMKRPGAKR